MAISAFTYYVFYRVFFIRRFSPAPRAFRSSWMNTAGELLEWRANVDGAVGGLDPSHVAALPVLPYHSRSVKSPVIATKTDVSSINLEKENNRLVSLPNFTPNERDAETKESSSPEASGQAEKGLIDKMICMRECAVCLCDFLEGEEVKVLPECGHFFHVKCVDQWLFFHPTCPICRLSLRPTPT
ncbi:hypothetical protein KP509_03G068200 [Ceratopteris richardii]|nr:hypothetical protein KP509_03G068200 [Ceratopteris richardii]